jgi:hypothetical protein
MFYISFLCSSPLLIFLFGVFWQVARPNRCVEPLELNLWPRLSVTVERRNQLSMKRHQAAELERQGQDVSGMCAVIPSFKEGTLPV